MWLMPKSIELERRRSKKRRNDKSRMYKVWKKRCNYKKGVRMGRERDLMARI